MRTAAKVFIILGMVFGAVLILPIIFGAIALQKMNDPLSKEDDYIVWGILVLIFVTRIGGIFLILLPTVEKDQGQPKVLDAKVEEKKEESK